MKRTVKFLLIFTCIVMLIVSCGKDNSSLQRYFVDHQETSNFITMDLPVSMLNLEETKLSKVQKIAYQSINRLNFLGFKLRDNNTKTYQTELVQIKTILKNEKYQDLIEFQDSGNKFIVKYLGNEDKADEVIILGSSSEVGFAVVRVLGKDMKPENMYTLMEAVRSSNVDASKIKEITSFFNN